MSVNPRFRRVGDYPTDSLLQDLQELDREVQELRASLQPAETPAAQQNITTQTFVVNNISQELGISPQLLNLIRQTIRLEILAGAVSSARDSITANNDYGPIPYDQQRILSPAFYEANVIVLDEGRIEDG